MKKRTYILVLLVGVAAFGVRSYLQPRLDNPDHIREILGYDFPDYWKINWTARQDNEYFWHLDGGEENNWFAAIGADPVPDSAKKWIVDFDNDGIHYQSRIEVLCPKGCCIGIAAPIKVPGILK